MPKVPIIQTNFSGGESSPFLRGRVDIPRYKASCEVLYNMIVLLAGGAARRPGTRFVSNAGTGITVRLMPFQIFNRDTAPPQSLGYTVIFRSDEKIWFAVAGAVIGNEGGVPTEITSPYADGTDLSLLRYDQGPDNNLIITHPDYAPQELKRITNTNWTIGACPIKSTPLARLASLSLPLSDQPKLCYAETVQPHGFATGMKIRIKGATETEYNGLFRITVESPEIFTYKITGAPETPATTTTEMTAGIGIASITRVNNTATVTTDKDHEFETDDYVTIEDAGQADYNLSAKITKISETQFSYTVANNPTTPATGTIFCTRMASLPFTSVTGYPQAVGHYQQRRVYASNLYNPFTLWLSKNYALTNFRIDVKHNSAMQMGIAAAKTDIMHVVCGKQIAVLTRDREFVVGPADKGALAPTNIDIAGYGRNGSGLARPVMVEQDVYFANRDSTQIRAFGYHFESDSMRSRDISFVSEHLTARGIVQLAYSPQQDLVYIVCADGTFLTLTVNAEYEVMAFAQHATDGLVKDLIVTHNQGHDEVWLAVVRTIGGVAKTYLEVMDDTLNTDCAVVDTDAGKATWDGLGHLEDKTVDVLADGIVMPQEVVDNGQITLPRNAEAVEIGLHYYSKIKDLPPEFQGGLGTVQAAQVSVNKVSVRLKDSLGCTINGEIIPFRKFGEDILDAPIEPFTGDKEATQIGWERGGGQVEIVQDQPLPFTVLAIIKEVSVNA